MKLILGIPTLNQHDFLIKELLPSLWKSTVLPDHIFLWDNGNCMREKLVEHNTIVQTYPKDKYVPITIVQNEENVGLSRAWNATLEQGKKLWGAEDFYAVLTNDDIRFHENTLEGLVNAANEDPRKKFYYPAAKGAGNSFSFFMIDRNLWEKVGPFDEGIVRAYFEDNDYHYRMKLVGEDIHGVVTVGYDHIHSATHKSLTPEERLIFEYVFRRNQAYYLAKWGGMPEKELYKLPFDGDPQGLEKFNANYRWE